MIEGFSRHLQPSLSGGSPRPMHTSPTLGLASLRMGWLACVAETREGAATLSWFYLLLNPMCEWSLESALSSPFGGGAPGARGAHICPCPMNPKLSGGGDGVSEKDLVLPRKGKKVSHVQILLGIG